jgi:hypothetical protein
MTPNEINEAIMMSLGYIKETHKRVPDSVLDRRYQPHEGAILWMNKEGAYLKSKPNYYADLNDCTEFERSFSSEDANHYVDNIGDIIGNGCIALAFDLITATARQRCEAYLKVKRLLK